MSINTFLLMLLVIANYTNLFINMKNRKKWNIYCLKGEFIWFFLQIWFYINRYLFDLRKLKKLKIGLSMNKAILFSLIVFIGFSSTSPKTRMILAESLESTAYFLYETVDTNNSDKWYVENRYISFIRTKFSNLTKGYAPSYWSYLLSLRL